MRAKAIQRYRQARSEGKSPSQAVNAVWKFIRQERKHLRAPNPFEAMDINTSCRRSYRSPIAQELGLDIPESFGQHSTQCPRTQASVKEATEIKRQIIAWFEDRAQSLLAA